MTATGLDSWPFTVAHFVVMGVFAALVVLGILWGMKLKRSRRHVQDEFDAHRAAADVPLAAPARQDEPPAVAAPAPASPVAPAPPPLGDPVSAPTSTDAGPAEPTAVASPVNDAPSPRQDAAPSAGDVTQLKGLGPKLAATLAELGITRVDQIAAMSPAELDALDARLGNFKGRPARDRWAEQARLLAAGDKAGYEAEFGKLGG